MSPPLHQPIDANGEQLGSGDRVKFLFAPTELVEGLPSEDRAAIERAVGTNLELGGFDEYGHAELDFRAADGNLHTIWVRPSCLALVSKWQG
jgi:hypothetical protein